MYTSTSTGNRFVIYHISAGTKSAAEEQMWLKIDPESEILIDFKQPIYV